MKRLALFGLLLTLSPRGATEAREGRVRWVWSGAVTERSAVVKAGIDPGSGVVRLRIGEREVEPFEVSPSGVAVFRLEGLSPRSDYEYRVVVDDAPTVAGRFRTFSREPMSFRFVFGSCARTGSDHEVFATMEALEPLFTLHMGDFHYENIRRNDPDEYRRAYERVLASARQASLYRSAPIAYVWDDHDFGPNDADGTHVGKPAALSTYDEVVPHYPLERVDGAPADVHQAFTVGRVRFLLTDVRSHRVPEDAPDGPDKTMLGGAQRDWLLAEIEAARDRYALVVWVNGVPWIAERGSEHGWGRYDWERRYIADRIRSLDMVHRLVMVSGDAHMVAIDDGTNSNFATETAPGERGFPVVHAAPFDRYPRPKGGPYSEGVAARKVLFGLVQIQQFGLAEVEDDGDRLQVLFTGRNEDGEVLDGMRLLLGCEASGCRVLESGGPEP